VIGLAIAATIYAGPEFSLRALLGTLWAPIAFLPEPGRARSRSDM
jgi:hypothetical protein